MGGAIIHCHRIQDKPKRLGVRRSPRWLAAVAARAVLGCAPPGARRWAGRTWPRAFVLVGGPRLDYRGG